jgi:hypothetical protein
MNSVQDQHSIFNIQALSVTEEQDAKPAMVAPEHDPLEPTAGSQRTNTDNDGDGGTNPNVKFWEEKIVTVCHGPVTDHEQVELIYYFETCRFDMHMYMVGQAIRSVVCDAHSSGSGLLAANERHVPQLST